MKGGSDMFKKITTVILLMLAFQLYVYAGNDVMVGPPPVPWFEFVEKQFDLRLNAAYASISDDEGLDVNGGQIGIYGRYGLSNVAGWDFGFSYTGGGGSAGSSTDVGVHNWTFSTNIEIQPVVGKKNFNMILFAGLSVPLTLTTLWTGSTTNETFAVMYGPQFGLQISLGLGSVEFNPFAKIQVVTGSYSTTIWTDTDTTYIDGDVETFTIPIIGFDLIFKPLDLTLSSLLQLSQSEEKYQTLLFSVSYTFHWDMKSKKK